jgi:hypothetical protein
VLLEHKADVLAALAAAPSSPAPDPAGSPVAEPSKPAGPPGAEPPTPPDELAAVIRWLSRNYVHPENAPTPDPVPRYLSREWFGEWLSRHPDGIAFIDERFREAELRELCTADAKTWLIMLLRRHGRDAEADALMGEESLGPDGRGPPPADRSWLRIVGSWSIPWREAWGALSSAIEDATQGTDHAATWREAEQGAYALLSGRFRPEGDQQCALDEITKELGWPRIVISGYAGDDVRPEPLTDAEAVVAIDWACSDHNLASAGPTARGPRDVRRRDKWLPWHLDESDRSVVPTH